ncbi:MAG: ribose-phosphate diphosphokinase [Gammaproteobacteria bacterium]|nr:ribose-phosphate diphosphokinase [Gammaproteobacteria bacterium]
MNQLPLILSFADSYSQSQRLARLSELPFAEINVHQFPDGESKLTLPLELPSHVIIYRSLDHPNNKLLEVLLAARGLREQSVETLTLIVPYLCYMRQDRAFQPGEIVSQRAIGQLLAEHFNSVLTVDSHLHRIHSLEQAVPADIALNLSATQPIADFLQKGFNNPVLLGPDRESQQWVEAIANTMTKESVDFCVASKQRTGDADVEIVLPVFDFSNRHVVIIDDVASTGHTLETTVQAVLTHSPASLSVLVTHALFVGNSLERLYNAGVDNIWSCDSITHSTNEIALDSVLKQGLACCIANPEYE